MRIEIVDAAQLAAFWIAFSRVATILFQLPIFEDVGVPMIVKILSSVVITYAIFPLISAGIIQDMAIVGESYWMVLAIYYTASGLLMGYLVKNITMSIMAAGSMASQQMGLGSVALFDPTTMVQVGPIEKILKWALLMLMLSSGSMLPMLKGIFLSFHSLSWAATSQLSISMDFFLDFFKDLFVLAIILSSPIIFINILLNLILGLVARFVPQLNLISVSFSVNIMAGFLLLIVGTSEILAVSSRYYTDYLGRWFQIVK
jgi:flagellar biosynthetic protein FliR